MLNNEKFKNYDLIYKKNLSKIRLTLDYKEDFELIKLIFESLYSNKKFFDLDDIIYYLTKYPNLLEINKIHNH